jgi:two-component system, LuxR family, sensor kinase FixL
LPLGIGAGSLAAEGSHDRRDESPGGRPVRSEFGVKETSFCPGEQQTRRLTDMAEDQAPRLQSIVNAIPDAIITISRDGFIDFFNPAAEQMFGYRADEVIGQNVKILMPSPYREQHDGYLSRYLTTGEKRILGVGRVVVGKRKDGSTFPMELAVGEASMAGRPVFAGLIRDISERRAMERQLHEVQADLIHVSRLSAMGDLAAALAHELNQPLTAINNYVLSAQRLLQGDPEQRKRVSDILTKTAEQAMRAGEIIRHLRNFIQRHEPEREPLDIHKVIDEATALAFIGMREKNIEVAYERTTDIPPVTIDKIQIQQVIINLIRNGVDAMDGMKQRKLTLATKIEADEIRISIADTGCGVSPEVTDRLFLPFVTTKSEGLGVGLSISRTIVEDHGGTLWFESNADSGTTFHLTLPIGRDNGNGGR